MSTKTDWGRTRVDRRLGQFLNDMPETRCDGVSCLTTMLVSGTPQKHKENIEPKGGAPPAAGSQTW